MPCPRKLPALRTLLRSRMSSAICSTAGTPSVSTTRHSTSRPMSTTACSVLCSPGWPAAKAEPPSASIYGPKSRTTSGSTRSDAEQTISLTISWRGTRPSASACSSYQTILICRIQRVRRQAGSSLQRPGGLPSSVTRRRGMHLACGRAGASGVSWCLLVLVHAR